MASKAEELGHLMLLDKTVIMKKCDAKRGSKGAQIPHRGHEQHHSHLYEPFDYMYAPYSEINHSLFKNPFSVIEKLRLFEDLYELDKQILVSRS